MSMVETRSDRGLKRLFDAVRGRYALTGLILTLFVIEYQLGFIHYFAAILEDFDGTLGSVFGSAAFALWIGGLVWAIRRRIELTEARKARAEAEAHAEAAGISDGLTGLPNRVGLRLELAARMRRVADIGDRKSTRLNSSH